MKGQSLQNFPIEKIWKKLKFHIEKIISLFFDNFSILANSVNNTDNKSERINSFGLFV